MTADDLTTNMREATATLARAWAAAESTSVNGWPCAPWCAESDGHPRESHRVDQWCQGPLHTVGCSLEELAPASHKQVDAADPHITAYACGRYYRLPYVALHLFRESSRPLLNVDTEFKLTPAEAVTLAKHLITVAQQIDDEVAK
ncbi:DUF6907 domain-containing protein [Mycolicibacter arupensis]|jgi:hypothetical protein|uniref:Uncharacterized protein n=1 Tax=Mycolicibacter arupensis TaxID=342002 RepID=A0A0F5MUW9_9MYCO|nr:hypothetical protein [Mycolicibacter arupensis]KKB98560.1 hypothetical protein WR43_13875 [Mycolicibacter arupensis]MCV7274139.1 hypothetical protein [Mycolicibacter arupensis]OQZ94084.1 hypothetical protein BST15_17175 [Mycolicibacter arupensis]TXI59972.1 MAG: hypothetical protein E6Q54_01510 [Mycolicibacter arupensis]